MIEVRKFRAADMLVLLREGVNEGGMRHDGNDLLNDIAAMREKSGLAYSGFVNGKLVGSAGLELYWEGVGQIWTLFSLEICKHPVSIYRCIVQGLKKMIDDNNMVHIQATARENFPAAQRMLEHLGFKKEALLRFYNPDKTHSYLYVRTEQCLTLQQQWR